MGNVAECTVREDFLACVCHRGIIAQVIIQCLHTVDTQVQNIEILWWIFGGQNSCDVGLYLNTLGSPC